MNDLDRSAIARGAVPAAVMALAVMAVGTIAADGGRASGIVQLIVLVLFVFAGFSGGRIAGRREVVHGAATAFAAGLAVGVAGMAIRLARRSDTSFAAELLLLPWLGLLAASCGLAGGYVASRSPRPDGAGSDTRTTEPTGGHPS